MLNRLVSAWLGDFKKGELKKFFLLSTIFSAIIGAYWLLRPIKNSIFMAVVGENFIPYAKIMSVVLLFPLVMIYSKLIDKYSRNKLFYVLLTVYGLIALIFAFIMQNPTLGLANELESPWRLWGWAFYLYIESFGSLLVALFWAFTTDVTKSESAADGFRLIVLGGQIGNILGPTIVRYVVEAAGYFEPGETGEFAPEAAQYEIWAHAGLVAFAGAVMLATIALVKLFMKVIPDDQLQGFEDVDTSAGEKKKESAGLFEGLKLLFTTPYLLGIFLLISFFEIIITVFDFNFNVLVKAAFDSVALRTGYLASYGQWTGIISLTGAILGINRIQKILGVSISLMLTPFLVLAAVFGFVYFRSITVLFWIMAISKAFNYALYQPTMKQLYIPTSKEAKYKSQAFIETYGSRGSKMFGSFINGLREIFMGKYGALAGSMFYISVCSYISFGLIGVWLVIALLMGRRYTKAIDEKHIIC